MMTLLQKAQAVSDELIVNARSLEQAPTATNCFLT